MFGQDPLSTAASSTRVYSSLCLAKILPQQQQAAHVSTTVCVWPRSSLNSSKHGLRHTCLQQSEFGQDPPSTAESSTRVYSSLCLAKILPQQQQAAHVSTAVWPRSSLNSSKQHTCLQQSVFGQDPPSTATSSTRVCSNLFLAKTLPLQRQAAHVSTAVCVWSRSSPNGKKHATKSSTEIMDLYIESMAGIRWRGREMARQLCC